MGPYWTHMIWGLRKGISGNLEKKKVYCTFCGVESHMSFLCPMCVSLVSFLLLVQKMPYLKERNSSSLVGYVFSYSLEYTSLVYSLPVTAVWFSSSLIFIFSKICIVLYCQQQHNSICYLDIYIFKYLY